jgi:agmatine/peptidylarginine deiminase
MTENTVLNVSDMTPRQLVKILALHYGKRQLTVDAANMAWRGLLLGVSTAESLTEEVAIVEHVIANLGDYPDAEQRLLQLVRLVCKNLLATKDKKLPRELAEFLITNTAILAKKGVTFND